MKSDASSLAPSREEQGWLNDRRTLPSSISIGEIGWTPQSKRASPRIVLWFKNLLINVQFNMPGQRVNGNMKFDTSTWDEDIRIMENLARRAMSIAMLWHYAGIDARPEEQREALLEAGYVRLGPWMTQRGFSTQFDNMLRVATFTKGNQKIRLAEGSREGFDGSTRKDHGHLIIGFQGELWAKTATLTSWVD